jgi:hypothetical protein
MTCAVQSTLLVSSPPISRLVMAPERSAATLRTLNSHFFGERREDLARPVIDQN